MAEAIAEGVTAEGVEAIVKSGKEVTYDEVVAADGVAFGTPQPFNMLPTAMKSFLEDNWAGHGNSRIIGKAAVCFIKGNTNTTPGVEAIDYIMGHYGVKKVVDTVGAREVT